MFCFLVLGLNFCVQDGFMWVSCRSKKEICESSGSSDGLGRSFVGLCQSM